MNLAARKVLSGLTSIFGEVVGIARRQIDFYRARPFTSTLFLTYRCNSECRTCTLWKRPAAQEISREIDIDDWKRIIDKLAELGISHTEIFGGNVLLPKELLASVLQYLNEKKFVVHFPTNQIGLDDEVARAIAAYCDFVYISTDGIGEYQNLIRGQKGAQKRVENTIQKLRRFRGDGRTPRLICNTTVSRYNVDILGELVEYADAMNFDEIHFEYAGEFTQEHIENSMIDGLRPSPYYVKQDESILVDRAGARQLKATLKRLKHEFARSNIVMRTINIDSLSEENLYQGTIPHRKCYVERCEVTVDPAGNVIICPFINNYVIGNMLNDPFEVLWRNGKHLRFRRLQNRGDLEMCDHCILGVQRNPGVFVSLKRVYVMRVRTAFQKYF